MPCDLGRSWASIYGSSVGWLENTRMSTVGPCIEHWKTSCWMRQEINLKSMWKYAGKPSLFWFSSTLYFKAQLFSAETAFSCVQLCRQADQLNHSGAKLFLNVLNPNWTGVEPGQSWTGKKMHCLCFLPVLGLIFDQCLSYRTHRHHLTVANGN
jgi:hypothetical protein